MKLHLKGIFYSDCLHLKNVDRFAYYTPPSFAPNTVNQTVEQNGVVWKGQPGGGWTFQSLSGGGQPGQAPAASAPSFQDVLGFAGSLNQQTIAANQPQIAALTAGSADLNTRYQNILQSITQGSQVAVNQQTQATNTTLGQRGIDPTSAYYQSQMASSLLPVQAAESGLYSQTSAGQGQDLLSLASQIGALQSGNIGAAQTSAQNIGNLLTGQSQFAQQLQSALALQSAQTQEALTASQYIPTAQGATLYNTANGQFANPLNSVLSSLGINLVANAPSAPTPPKAPTPANNYTPQQSSNNYGNTPTAYSNAYGPL